MGTDTDTDVEANSPSPEPKGSGACDEHVMRRMNLRPKSQNLFDAENQTLRNLSHLPLALLDRQLRAASPCVYPTGVSMRLCGTEENGWIPISAWETKPGSLLPSRRAKKKSGAAITRPCPPYCGTDVHRSLRRLRNGMMISARDCL